MHMQLSTIVYRYNSTIWMLSKLNESVLFLISGTASPTECCLSSSKCNRKVSPHRQMAFQIRHTIWEKKLYII